MMSQEARELHCTAQPNFLSNTYHNEDTCDEGFGWYSSMPTMIYEGIFAKRKVAFPSEKFIPYGCT